MTSDLVLTLYRAYDPELGRWLSRDPLQEQAGLNLYGYVGGDPIRLFDPYGLDSTETWGEKFADWVDTTSSRFAAGISTEYTLLNFFPAVAETMHHGAAELFRFGRGISDASYCTQGDMLDKAAVAAPDAVRFGGWLSLAAGGLKNVAVKRTPFVPGEYWNSLARRAPVRSTPFNVVRKYNVQGELRGATTYDEFGNRAYQYEFGSTVRHGEGYHVYDNSTTGALGDGPRSPHINY